MSDVLKPEVDDYNTFGAAVYTFNRLAGNLDPAEDANILVQRIKNQAERVLEEAQETVNWCNEWLKLEQEQPTEVILEGILDGIIDTQVTSIGLLQIAGPYFDTQLAATLICQNNLTKFTQDLERAEIAVAYYEALGQPCVVREVKIDSVGSIYSVVREVDGKIMKPHDFESVDLKDCLYLEEIE